MRKLVLALAAASLAIPAAPPAPAFAQRRPPHGPIRHGPDARPPCRGSGGAARDGDDALAGRGMDGHGARTNGTLLGAALGALLGRHAERNVVRSCR
jgi:hypothetical protein